MSNLLESARKIVGEGLPAKQGLKQIAGFDVAKNHDVGEGLPAKQGLKRQKGE